MVKGKKVITLGILIIILLLIVWSIRNTYVNREDIVLEIERNVYIEEYVEIYYPQFTNMKDNEKMQRVNALIMQDIKKIIQSGYAFTEEALVATDGKYEGVFTAHLNYEICYMSEDYVSIVYTGSCGHIVIGGGKGIPRFLMATNIDIENEQILTLKDFIFDLEELNNLLLEDRFEYVSEWKGSEENWLVSREYAGREEQLLENLQDSIFDIYENYVDWYIEENKFVFVSSIKAYYEKYAIDIAEIEKIINEKYVDSIFDSKKELEYEEIILEKEECVQGKSYTEVDTFEGNSVSEVDEISDIVNEGMNSIDRAERRDYYEQVSKVIK